MNVLLFTILPTHSFTLCPLIAHSLIHSLNTSSVIIRSYFGILLSERGVVGVVGLAVPSTSISSSLSSESLYTKENEK